MSNMAQWMRNQSEFKFNYCYMTQDCVYQTPVRDVAHLSQRLIDRWHSLSQSIVNGGRY